MHISHRIASHHIVLNNLVVNILSFPFPKAHTHLRRFTSFKMQGQEAPNKTKTFFRQSQAWKASLLYYLTDSSSSRRPCLYAALYGFRLHIRHPKRPFRREKLEIVLPPAGSKSAGFPHDGTEYKASTSTAFNRIPLSLRFSPRLNSFPDIQFPAEGLGWLGVDMSDVKWGIVAVAKEAPVEFSPAVFAL